MNSHFLVDIIVEIMNDIKTIFMEHDMKDYLFMAQ